MSSSTYAAMVLASSPLLYYKLDEVSGNFADAGSAALTATANGTGLAYQQPDTFGETKSVSLADPNYIEVADDAALDTPTTAITVELLVNWTGAQSSTMCAARWDGIGTDLVWWLGPGSAGRLRWDCYLDGVQRIVDDDGSKLKNDGKWHHAAGVYNGSQVLLYIDGTSVGTPVSVSSSFPASVMPLRLGRLSNFSGWNFTGKLAHVAVYSTALSAVTIKNHAIEALGMERNIQRPKSYAQLHNRYFL